MHLPKLLACLALASHACTASPPSPKQGIQRFAPSPHLTGASSLSPSDDGDDDAVGGPRCYTLSVVTWNWAERAPSVDDCDFLRDLGTTSDIVVIGVQVRSLLLSSAPRCGTTSRNDGR